MRLRKASPAFCFIALTLILAACGGGTKPGAGTTPAPNGSSPGFVVTPPASSTATSSPALTVGDVLIVDNSYQPDEITVRVGSRVTWTHTGAAIHSVTADDESFDSSPSCPSPPSGCMMQGATFSFAFTKAGRFAYHCRVHTTLMTGTVIVQ
jgi:plastocyanin